MNREEEKYLKKLSYFGKADLQKFVKFFHGEEIEGTNKELRVFLVDNYIGELLKFFEIYQYACEVRFNHLLKAVCNEYPNKVQEIERFKNSKQIVLFLYGNGEVEKLEEIVNKGRIERVRLKENYILSTEQEITIQQIKDNISGFIEMWNSENPWKINIKTNQSGENSLKLFFYVEGGRAPFRQFVFRKEDSSYNTREGLEVSKSLTYPVYIKSCEFEKIDNKKFKLTVPFSEKPWFRDFLSYTVGEYKIEKTDKKLIEVLTKNVRTKLDISPDYSTPNDVINDMKTKVKSFIDKSSLPRRRKTEINKIVNSINYVSPRLKNEVRSGIDNFVWLADFDKCEKVIPYSKRIIQEIYDKIPESRDSFFITIGDKRKPVLFEKDKIKRQANLSEDEEIGLKIFIGGEDAIKEIS